MIVVGVNRGEAVSFKTDTETEIVPVDWLREGSVLLFTLAGEKSSMRVRRKKGDKTTVVIAVPDSVRVTRVQMAGASSAQVVA